MLCCTLSFPGRAFQSSVPSCVCIVSGFPARNAQQQVGDLWAQVAQSSHSHNAGLSDWGLGTDDSPSYPWRSTSWATSGQGSHEENQSTIAAPLPRTNKNIWTASSRMWRARGWSRWAILAWHCTSTLFAGCPGKGCANRHAWSIFFTHSEELHGCSRNLCTSWSAGSMQPAGFEQEHQQLAQVQELRCAQHFFGWGPRICLHQRLSCDSGDSKEHLVGRQEALDHQNKWEWRC